MARKSKAPGRVAARTEGEHPARSLPKHQHNGDGKNPTSRRASKQHSSASARRDRLSKLLDRELEKDRRFFRQNPNTEYRVRLTGPTEAAEAENYLGRPMVAPEGCELYTIVRALHPKVRLRNWMWAEPAIAAALSQEDMADLWSCMPGPHGDSAQTHAWIRDLLGSEA